MTQLSFNLVIENLIFSSLRFFALRKYARTHVFQSRNRESYLFKYEKGRVASYLYVAFQSRNRESYLFKQKQQGCCDNPVESFNLVIENLIFSSSTENVPTSQVPVSFQSRNRESYLFKRDESTLETGVLEFQSRNRESYLFKRPSQNR